MSATTSTQTVLIVTGMDRSGTSWVASAIQASGVFMGQKLFPANRGNPFGYFEDEDFLEFHIDLCRRANIEGLNKYSYLDPLAVRLATTQDDIAFAQNLIAQRQQHPLWGFKDPRAALWLDFWAQLIPNLRVICLYRHPLLVSLSLFARGDSFADLGAVFNAFQHRMAMAIDFKERHPGQLLLCNIEQVIASPGRLEKALAGKLNLSLPELTSQLQQRFHSDDFSQLRPGSTALAGFYRHYPQVAAFYEQLEKAADLPAPRDSDFDAVVSAAKATTDLAELPQDTFVALVEDGVAVPAIRRKIVTGFLEHVKISGGLQFVQGRLQAEVDNISAERDQLYEALSETAAAYEHRLNSQDLVTRQFLKVTGRNLLALVRHPRRVAEKLKNWLRYRVFN